MYALLEPTISANSAARFTPPLIQSMRSMDSIYHLVNTKTIPFGHVPIDMSAHTIGQMEKSQARRLNVIKLIEERCDGVAARFSSITGIDDEGRPPLNHRLKAMIQPERSQPPGIKGEIFDIVFVGDPTTHDRATIGCVFVTEQGYIYPKLVDEEIFDIMVGHYNRAYADNARFAARVVRDELAKGSLANPLPINVTYTEPVYACYPTPMVALNRRFAYKVSYFREPELREIMQGGYAGNFTSSHISYMHYVLLTMADGDMMRENKVQRVYEGKAYAASKTKGSPSTYKAMIHGLMKDFPGESGTSKNVSVIVDENTGNFVENKK